MKETKSRSFFLTSLPFFILAHCAHHLLTALHTPLLPFIRNEFELNYTRSSFVTSAFSLAYGIGQLPAGFLADRIGSRLLIMIGTMGVAIGGILVGISQTYILLLVFLVLMGLLGGGYHPAATPLISASVEPQKRGQALGFHLIGGNSSFFIAPVVAGAIASAWGWRGAFFGLAIPTAVFGLLFFIYLTKWGSKSQTDAARKVSGEEKAIAPGNIRRLVAFLIMTVLSGGAGVMSFLSLYAVDVLGASEQTAASLLSILHFSGLWAGPVGGYISDRVGRLPVIIITSLLGGILIFVLKFTTLGMGFYAVLFIMGMNAALRGPVSEAFVMSQTTARHRSKVFGVYYFVMMETGAVLAPIIGQFIDRWGFDICFNIVSATTVIATLTCSVFLRGGQE